MAGEFPWSARRTLAPGRFGYADPVTVLDVAYWAICLVLVTSGALKISGPEGFAAFIGPMVGAKPAIGLARLSGVAEFVLGFVGLATGGRLVAVLVTLTYAGFTVVVYSALRRSLPSCGCFGQASAPPSGAHLGMNLVSTVVAVVASIRSTPSVFEGLDGIGWWAVIVVIAILVVAVLVVVVDTNPLGATFLPRNTYGGTDERDKQHRD